MFFEEKAVKKSYENIIAIIYYFGMCQRLEKDEKVIKSTRDRKTALKDKGEKLKNHFWNTLQWTEGNFAVFIKNLKNPTVTDDSRRSP